MDDARDTFPYRGEVVANIDLTMCSKKSSHHVFEFEKVAPSLRLLGEGKVDGEGSREGRGVQESVKGETLPIKLNLGVEVRSLEDTELDQLLERNLVVRREGMVGKNVSSTAAAVTTKEVISSAVAPVGGHTSARMNAEETTDELDDMLDDLLS